MKTYKQTNDKANRIIKKINPSLYTNNILTNEFKKHLLNIIEVEDYPNNTLKENLLYILEDFKRVGLHHHNKIKFNNNRELIFKDFLQGLPSYMDVYAYYSDMREFFVKIDPLFDQFDDTTINNLYYKSIYYTFNMLCKENKIKKNLTTFI